LRGILLRRTQRQYQVTRRKNLWENLGSKR